MHNCLFVTFIILCIYVSFSQAQPTNCAGTYTKYNFTYYVSQQATITYPNVAATTYVGPGCQITNPVYSPMVIK